MTALFFVYDTVDKEVVLCSPEWPGFPRSVYRPLYWHGYAGQWRKYEPVPEGADPHGEVIHESLVPPAVKLFAMVAT